ncbi:MAG: hydantoinase B/oxoprolinase family protein, partial [Hyphomicrobiales bacterium]
DVRNTPVELQEIKYPVLVETHALRPDSGGTGKHRGGLGVELTYQLPQKCKANINLDRTRDPPWGLHGGGSGAVNVCTIHRADGTAFNIKKATEIEIAAGDKVVFLTAGGGGYGDPKQRAPEAIAQDEAAGVVTGKGGT